MKKMTFGWWDKFKIGNVSTFRFNSQHKNDSYKWIQIGKFIIQRNADIIVIVLKFLNYFGFKYRQECFDVNRVGKSE